MEKLKSYNPFKMNGSYVGASVGLILIFIVATINTSYKNFNIEFLNRFFNIILYPIDKLFPNITNAPPFILFILIMGFLIGWGIHSLFRRFS